MIPPFGCSRPDAAGRINQLQSAGIGDLSQLEKGFAKMFFIGFLYGFGLIGRNRDNQGIIFTTGQGNPYGSALAPTIKVSANPDTTARLGEQIDFDASSVVTGETTSEALAPALHGLLIDVAGGALTWSEAAGETAESISRLEGSV